jgi:hypothetical protein
MKFYLEEKTHHKKGQVEWLKVKALSSNSRPQKTIQNWSKILI